MSSSNAPESTPGGRSRLLDAAAAEFSASGYAGASIAAIARRAAVSKSTVFHHFESKEDLYLAVIGEAVADFTKRLEHVLAPDMDGPQALEGFQLEHLRHLRSHRQVARLIMRELQDPALERRKPLIMELLSTNYTRLVRFIEQSQASGRLRESLDPNVAALMMFAVNAFYFQHADDLARLPAANIDGNDEGFARAVIDILYDGLAPRESDGDRS